MREQKGLKMNEGKVNINLNDMDDVVCENCGNPTFIQVVLLKRVSAVMSPSGKKSFLPMPVFECSSCGHVNDELLPKQADKKDSKGTFNLGG
tara:strand:+ start:2437 stop:2712 length:276 start_codon:yes stop_codon:yes gene_type:complete